MSTFTAKEKSQLESLLGMSTGYVSHYSDRTIENFFADFDVDILGDKYKSGGSSKANRLRTFWKIEPDQLVGQVMFAMIDDMKTESPLDLALMDICKKSIQRLLSGKIDLNPLKETASQFNLQYMQNQLRRIETAVETEPDLAIGTSKELIETCCKTILLDLSVEFDEKNDDLLKLTKITMKHLKLLPEDIDSAAIGIEAIKKILGSLSTITQGVAELRNKYGTGHGKTGRSAMLQPRHARLVVGATSTLVHFLFDTHTERKTKQNQK